MFTAHSHHLVEDSINEPESHISCAAANEVIIKKTNKCIILLTKCQVVPWWLLFPSSYIKLRVPLSCWANTELWEPFYKWMWKLTRVIASSTSSMVKKPLLACMFAVGMYEIGVLSVLQIACLLGSFSAGHLTARLHHSRHGGVVPNRARPFCAHRKWQRLTTGAASYACLQFVRNPTAHLVLWQQLF